MSWRPTGMSTPPHRLDQYAFRACDILDRDGAVLGHALVLPMVYWAVTGGRLWWRRWGKPETTADVWVVSQGVEEPFGDSWYREAVLDEILDLWDKGQLVVRGDPDDTVYPVRWLDDQATVTVARENFGADLERLQAERG
jgi:hypothetical protein